MKFTTLIPTTWNDGAAIKPASLERILDALWRPFRAMTREGYVTGHWIDEDGTEFTDVCLTKCSSNVTATASLRQSKLSSESAAA